jgi:hypothetical protein
LVDAFEVSLDFLAAPSSCDWELCVDELEILWRDNRVVSSMEMLTLLLVLL